MESIEQNPNESDVHIQNNESEKNHVQHAPEYEAAISKAWSELDLDPTITGNPALSPSGQGCCACY